jgi:hypothetical protein
MERTTPTHDQQHTASYWVGRALESVADAEATLARAGQLVGDGVDVITPYRIAGALKDQLRGLHKELGGRDRCPLCGGAMRDTTREGDRFEWLQCERCNRAARGDNPAPRENHSTRS